jgi:hypothetical protein
LVNIAKFWWMRLVQFTELNVSANLTTATMTKAQQKVIDRLKEIGAGWLGSGIDRKIQTINLSQKLKLIKAFFGKREYERFKKQMKRYGITNKGVWCSNTTYAKLMQKGLIVPIESVPGCYTLPKES